MTQAAFLDMWTIISNERTIYCYPLSRNETIYDEGGCCELSCERIELEEI